MRLLSKKEVKTSLSLEQRESALALLDVTKAVREEETKLNKIRADAEREKKHLVSAYTEQSAEYAEKIIRLQEKVYSLQEKADELEKSADAELLKTRLRELDERESQILTRAKFYASWKDELDEKAAFSEATRFQLELESEKLRQQKGALDRLNAHLNQRELSCKTQEEKIEAGKKEFAILRERTEIELNKRLQKLDLLEQAQSALQDSLAKQAAEIENDRRAIKDGYDSLAKARVEILGRKN